MKKDTATRQKEIIEASIVIMEGGIQKVTMKEIAKRLGISEQAIYRHFENKLAILAAIIQYFRRHVKGIFEQVQDIESPTQQIQGFIEKLFEHFQQHPEISVIVTSEEIFKNESSLNQEIQKLTEDRIDFMKKTIQKGQKAGEIKDNYPAEDLAFIILGTCRYLVTTWRLSSFSFSLQERGKSIAEKLADLIKKG